MMRFPLPIALLLLLAACGDDDGTCPDGSVPSAGRCVDEDTGTDAGDARPDTADAADSGACSPECTLPEVCNPTTNRCVRCVEDTDCGGATPRCLESACVACAPATATDDCSEPNPLCTAAGACVQCTSPSDCNDPTLAGCNDAGQCAQCTSGDDCVGTGLAACVSGTCMECSATNETACGDDVCDVTLNTCAIGTPAGETGLCGDCVSDRQCNEGQLCTPMVFGAESTPVGNHCLWREDSALPGAPMGDCVGVRPYVGAQAATSIGGTEARVCGLSVTTCVALAHFRMQTCDTPFDSDDMCGIPGLPDGRCRMFSAGTNYCTIVCGGDIDCPDGSSCDTTVSPRVCRF